MAGPLAAALLDVALKKIDDFIEKKATPDWFEDDQWHGLISSNVMAFKYDGSTLSLRFKGGRDYAYFSIPSEMVHELVTSSSPGGWWHANLKGAPAQRL